jgi:two-component system, chemotaxis family, sensor kinase Cph1
MIDLTNKTVATITDCDQEPIHIPGSIQPHGYLLALQGENGIITHASANVAELLGVPLHAVLGTSLFQFLPASDNESLRYLTIHPDAQNKRFAIQIGGRPYLCAAHRQQEYLILEVEPVFDTVAEAHLIQTYDLLDVIKLSGNLTTLCQNLAAYFRKTLGYDRIMIYRFDQEDHTGEVIAESMREGLESYLGLRYPASDIPPQARELYLKNPLRAIADTFYESAALYTLPGSKGSIHQLDLSLAYLRSVSPIHIQYLKNMGVASSLSVAIVRENKLWGLIACHHGSPRYLTLRERDSAHLLGLLLSSQIDLHERADSAADLQEIDKSLNLASLVFDQEVLSLSELITMPELLAIAGATGVALLYEGRVHTQGLTPTPEEIKILALLLSEYTGNASFSTKKLAGVYPKAEKLTDTAAGLVYEPLSQLDESCMIWFRPGLEQTITWAGQPKDRTASASTAQKLTPRSSFGAWQEIVRHTSAGWSPAHLRAVHHFASLFQKHARLLRLQQEADKQRALNEKMKAANEELENIHWISMHDLREPLRKIQVLASRVLSQEAQGLTDSLMDSINRMNNSAKKMQNLLEDISAYSRIASDKKQFVPVDLNELLCEIIENRQEALHIQGARIEYNDLPTVSGIHYQLKQLMEQLIDNALKFGKPNEAVSISLQYAQPSSEIVDQLGTSPDNFFAIVIQDNGIGFENEFRSIIFRLFKRLNNETRGPQGTGIGLAICKKIMLNHEGYIWADSQPGQGSKFHLIFPKAQLL